MRFSGASRRWSATTLLLWVSTAVMFVFAIYSVLSALGAS